MTPVLYNLDFVKNIFFGGKLKTLLVDYKSQNVLSVQKSMPCWGITDTKFQLLQANLILFCKYKRNI